MILLFFTMVSQADSGMIQYDPLLSVLLLVRNLLSELCYRARTSEGQIVKKRVSRNFNLTQLSYLDVSFWVYQLDVAHDKN
jgi:hypothetical protein